MHIAWLIDLQGPSLSAFFLAGGRDGGEKVVFWGETKLLSPFSTVLASSHQADLEAEVWPR